MQISPQDLTLIALTAWRENRGGRPQPQAMQSVVNVIMNRAAKYGESPFHVCTQHAQFSSISMPGPESCLWPIEGDPQWQMALSLAEQAALTPPLADITGGATSYYAQTMVKPPYWAESMTQTVIIGGQVFFKS